DHPKPDGRGINISGVDFWHAVEFSRNGRFLRTHPLGLSSGRFPSVFPTLADLFLVLTPRQRGPSRVRGLSPVGLSTITTLTDSPSGFIIRSSGIEFRHANMTNSTPPRGDRR